MKESVARLESPGMDVLVRIKRLVIRGQVRLTEKAAEELDFDALTLGDVLESILNAQAIAKTIRSTSRHRGSSRERLYVIKSFNYTGTLIYTKGAIRREAGADIFYVLISSKIATLED
ncbi:MAG: hypothetical protein IT449_02370 [Phycisphaerales bacterium]|nr:hypothetical protein [Phycisphaerales bacterium]